MAQPAWLNDNQFRDYPFVTRMEPLGVLSLRLPHSAILDFGAIMEIEAEYDERDGHYVYLYSVSRAVDTLTFRFRSNAPEAQNHEIVVQRLTTATEFQLTQEDAVAVGVEPLSPFGCSAYVRWSGFVITGSMADMAELIADGETQVAEPAMWQIEPARVQSLSRSYLRVINLANSPRTHCTPVAGCEEEGGDEDDAIIPLASCLQGEINWREGFNCVIRQDDGRNAIVIGAGVGVGEGMPCAEIPLFEGESPPVDSPFLSGGPSCAEIIKSINGVSGRDISLVAGPGFQIQPDPENDHRLIIDRSLNDLARCGDDVIVPDPAPEEPGPVCAAFTTYDSFEVTLLAGLLTDPDINTTLTVTCQYVEGLPATSPPTWRSDPVLVTYWQNGTFCGFRWRAQITCREAGLRVSILGYPLADNNPCRVCMVLLPPPLSLPLNTTQALTCEQTTEDCGCVELELVTSIQVSQLPA